MRPNFGGLTVILLSLVSSKPIQRDDTPTAHVTVTDHTTVTEVVTQTAYIIDSLPIPCAAGATGIPVTTIQPSLPSPSIFSAGSSTVPNPEPSSSSVPATAALSPSSSNVTTQGVALQPAVPATIDPNSISTLQPTPNCSHSWTEDGTYPAESSYIFAEANITYQYPTVVLPHTSLISNISCESYGLDLTFTDLSAYNFAKTNWTGQFLLVTTDVHCKAADAKGDHVFWLVQSLAFDDASRTIKVTAEEIAVEDAYAHVSVIWGTWSPSGSSGGTSWSAGPGSPSSTSNSSSSTPPSDPGSSSPYTNSSLSCTNPPDSYLGLPTAPCGDDFDAVLDSKIGYFSDIESTSETDQFVPDVALTRRHVRERDVGSWVSNTWKKTTNTIKTTAVNAGKSVASGATSAANNVVSTTKTVVTVVKEAPGKVVDIVKTGYNILTGKPFSTKTTFDTTNKIQIVSPFSNDANAVLVYSAEKDDVALWKAKGKGELSVYCVKCGTKGNANIAGQLDYSIIPSPKVNKAVLSVSGTLYSEYNIGLSLEAALEKKFKKNLVSLSLPELGIDIGSVASIGISVAVDFETTFSLGGAAKVLLGANMTIDNFNANLDYLNPLSSTVSGFTPRYNTTFEASGELTAKMGLGLPLSIGVGVNLPAIKYDGRIALVNKPEIVASAGITIANTATKCNGGVLLKAGLADSFIFNAIGIKEFTMAKFEKDDLFGSLCIPISTKLSNALEQTPLNATERRSLRSRFDSSNISSVSHSATPTVVQATIVTSATTSLGVSSSYLQSTNNSSSSNSVQPSSTASSPSSTPLSLNSTSSPLTSTNDTTMIPFDQLQYDDTFLDSDNSTGIDSDVLNGIDASLNATVDGFTYVALTDLTGQYSLFAWDDGNFYLVPSSDGYNNEFASLDSVVIGSGDDATFFFYPDEMKALGVSRWRSGDEDSIPISADIIGLVSINYDDSDDTPGVYVAADTAGNFYYTAICSITDEGSKAFLISDPEVGLQTLMKPELQYVVTGGIVEECSLLALVTNSVIGY